VQVSLALCSKEGVVESLAVIIFNGLGMLVCFIIGLIIAKWGYSIYKTGGNSPKDTQLIEWGNFKVTSKGGGSIVMSTAVVWAIVGFNVSPSITQTEYGPNYTSIFNGENEELTIVSSTITNPAALKQPQVLKSYLAQELISGGVNAAFIKINGLSGELDGKAINYLVNEVGDVTLTAQATGAFGGVVVWFEPSVNSEGKLVFEAKGVASQVVNEPNKALKQDR
jgi:hypothetical protein